MRVRVTSAVFAALMATALLGCGGGEQNRPGWQASERLPDLTSRWWWEPVEEACEDDEDCENGATCTTLRLTTCANCPPGEQAKACTGGNQPEQGGRQASGDR